MNLNIMAKLSQVFVFLLFCSCGTVRVIDEKYAASTVKNTLAIVGNVTAQKLSGGFSGAHVFLVSADSKKYVIRFSKNLPKDEIDCLKIASQQNYGPHFYCADEKQGFVIMEYLPHQEITSQQRQSNQLYEALAHLLQKIHRGPAFETSKDIFSHILRLIYHLKENSNYNNVSLTKIENLVKAIQQKLSSHILRTPCHNDLNPNNLRWWNNEFKAIDYAAAGNDDPYVDLATIAVFYCHSPVYEKVFLTTYLDRQPSPQEEARFYVMKQIVLFLHGIEFLEMVPELVSNYDSLHVPSYIEFLREMAADKAHLEDSHDQLRFAKIMITLAFANAETSEFHNAMNVLV